MTAIQNKLSSLQTTVDQKQNTSRAVKLAADYCTGNGYSSRTISVGFTPKAVLVIPENAALS